MSHGDAYRLVLTGPGGSRLLRRDPWARSAEAASTWCFAHSPAAYTWQHTEWQPLSHDKVGGDVRGGMWAVVGGAAAGVGALQCVVLMGCGVCWVLGVSVSSFLPVPVSLHDSVLALCPAPSLPPPNTSSSTALSLPPSLLQAVIYEMHVGSFTEEGTLAAAAARLPHVAALGFTMLELMPCQVAARYLHCSCCKVWHGGFYLPATSAAGQPAREAPLLSPTHAWLPGSLRPRLLIFSPFFLPLSCLVHRFFSLLSSFPPLQEHSDPWGYSPRQLLALQRSLGSPEVRRQQLRGLAAGGWVQGCDEGPAGQMYNPCAQLPPSFWLGSVWVYQCCCPSLPPSLTVPPSLLALPWLHCSLPCCLTPLLCPRLLRPPPNTPPHTHAPSGHGFLC